MNHLPRIALFASGDGSNTQRIVDFFSEKGILEISAIYCNNPDAYVLERAKLMKIPHILFNRSIFYQTHEILDDLITKEVDWVILAGFLWLVPDYMIKAFPNKIINIHPALLPKYGGKGMYGARVHEAVIASGETESGITIHFVNERYDEGQIILQERCQVTSKDTPESLALKIHKLEHHYFPEVIEQLVQSRH
jgi:phosphoribosylglycinamide formyltransferase 1